MNPVVAPLMAHRHNPELLSLPQLISAKKKLGVCAAFYDTASSSLKSFLDVASMTATEFRQQLSRNLDINLTDEELGALVTYLDNDNSKNVNCEEFVKAFFELGRIVKLQISYKHKEEQNRREMRVKKWRMQKEETFARLTASEVDQNFTSSDENSALRKIAKTAFDYDKTKGGLESFMDGTTLTGAEFKDMIRLSLGIKLTSKETGALVKLLDTKNTGMIDCHEFLVAFSRLGRIERKRYEEKQLKLKLQHDKVKQSIQETHLNLVKKREEIQLIPYTEDDYQNFKEKIFAASLRFERNDVDRVKSTFGHEDHMNAGEFRDFLFTFFRIELTLGELDAAMKIFDLNHDGIVKCADFLSTMYRIQWRAKAREKKNIAYKQYMKKYKEEEFWRKKEEEALRLLQTHVIWPDLNGPARITTDIGQDNVFLTQSNDSVSNEDSKVPNSSSSLPKFRLINNSNPSPIRSKTASSIYDKNISSGNSINEINDSEFNKLFSPSINSVSSSNNVSQRQSRNGTRKQKKDELFSVGRFANKLVTTNQSIAEYFPSASSDTREFIRELEKKEHKRLSPKNQYHYDKKLGSTKFHVLRPILNYKEELSTTTNNEDNELKSLNSTGSINIRTQDQSNEPIENKFEPSIVKLPSIRNLNKHGLQSVETHNSFSIDQSGDLDWDNLKPSSTKSTSANPISSTDRCASRGGLRNTFTSTKSTLNDNEIIEEDQQIEFYDENDQINEQSSYQNDMNMLFSGDDYDEDDDLLRSDSYQES